MPTKQRSAVNAALPDQARTDPIPAAQPTETENDRSTGERKWSVTIPYVPPTIVEASDEADAWEKFKAKWGIVKSEHVPVITAGSSQ
jgi:hypothetical protein